MRHPRTEAMFEPLHVEDFWAGFRGLCCVAGDRGWEGGQETSVC